MTRIIKHAVPRLTVQATEGENKKAYVSITAPPWPFDPDAPYAFDDRSDTAPRGGPFKADRPWDADPIVRHADRLARMR